MFSRSAIFYMCRAASSGFNWIGEKKALQCNDTYIVIAFCVPSCLTDTHSNVDFYLKFDIQNSDFFLTVLDVTHRSVCSCFKSNTFYSIGRGAVLCGSIASSVMILPHPQNPDHKNCEIVLRCNSTIKYYIVQSL